MTTVDLGRYKRLIKYIWDPEPHNDDTTGSPIWCLGQEYPVPVPTVERPTPGSVAPVDDAVIVTRHTESLPDAPPITSDDRSSILEDEAAYKEATEALGPDRGWPATFLDDFESRIWLTYRSHFPPIAKSQNPGAESSMSFSVRLRSQLVDHTGFTSDTGWGCMIRSGQCVLANALLTLRLGRDWRRGRCPQDERRLLALFADDPQAPFSIHRFVEHGASACGKHPGEWFGPSATARCIQALSNEHLATEMRVYMTGDGSDVYEDTFKKMAHPSGGAFCPTLILVGIRLGIDRVTPVYWDALRTVLQMPQSMGIAGGRPSSSHYFVGVQGHNFFYLDPHQTRNALPLHLNPNGYTEKDVSSCHTRRLRRLHVEEMDPSMLLAFLVRDQQDWAAWRQRISSLSGKSVVHIADQDPGPLGHAPERASALDEVEVLDDEDEESHLPKG